MKNILITIAVIILIILGLNFFGKDANAPSPSQNNDAMMEEEKMMDEAMMEEKDEDGNMMSDDKMMEGEGNMEGEMMSDEMSKSGTYEKYSPEKLALANSGNVVLFFKASWCPTCRALDADIKNNLSQLPAGTHILEVDYDNSAELRQKYGVTVQHTLVQVDANGNLVAKWLGSANLDALLAQVK